MQHNKYSQGKVKETGKTERIGHVPFAWMHTHSDVVGATKVVDDTR